MTAADDPTDTVPPADAGPDASRESRWYDWSPSRPIATGAALAALGFVVLILRRPSAVTDPGLYAEDGVIFLLQSLVNGAGAIFHPYNGYVHLLPRLIAAVATWLPLGWTPVVYALSSGAVAVGAASMVLSQRFARLLPRYPERVLLFALLVFLPRLTEVHLALNSILWWCGVALLITALSDDPATRIGRVAELVMVLVAALSGLAGAVLAPIAALRWWRTRSLQSALVAGVWWAAGIAQLAVYATQDRNDGAIPVGPKLARAAVEKTFGALVLGQRTVDRHWVGGVPMFVLVGLTAIGLVWAAIVVRGTSWTDWLALGWTIVFVTAAGFAALGVAAAALPDRYTVLPTAALLIGLVVAHPTMAPLRWARYALLAVVVVLRVTDVEVPARPSTHWDRSEHCLDDVRRTCVVPLNPEGWTVTLPPNLR